MYQASDDSDSDFDSYINKSASEDEDQQITATVLQIKPATLHLLLFSVLHLIQPLLVILPPTQLYIHNI